jgi:hypothetical protein
MPRMPQHGSGLCLERQGFIKFVCLIGAVQGMLDRGNPVSEIEETPPCYF